MKTTLYCILVTSQFFSIWSCLLSPLAVFTPPSPLPFVQEKKKCKSAHLECCSWGLIKLRLKKKALASSAKRGSGRKKKQKGRKIKINCLIKASGGTESVTPMHTPGFCQADRHDYDCPRSQISEPLFQNKSAVGLSVWKEGRASRPHVGEISPTLEPPFWNC